LQLKKVHYYTVLLEGKPVTEFRDFGQRMSGNESDKVELAEINRYIMKIGRDYGARPVHFRDEGAAEGLPPPYHQFIESDTTDDYGLRLFCIRLSPSVVILLNGGRKTALKVKECENCYPHFKIAERISKNINQAIADGFFEINEEAKEIVMEKEFQLSI
jgi:hypothetical protein